MVSLFFFVGLPVLALGIFLIIMMVDAVMDVGFELIERGNGDKKWKE